MYTPTPGATGERQLRVLHQRRRRRYRDRNRERTDPKPRGRGGPHIRRPGQRRVYDLQRRRRRRRGRDHATVQRSVGRPDRQRAHAGAEGTYSSTSTWRPAAYRLVAAQPAGFLDGRETAGNLGGTVDNSSGQRPDHRHPRRHGTTQTPWTTCSRRDPTVTGARTGLERLQQRRPGGLRRSRRIRA